MKVTLELLDSGLHKGEINREETDGRGKWTKLDAEIYC